MANFCENCGSPLKSDNKFCPNCGAPVKDAGAASPAVSGMPDTPPVVPSTDMPPRTAGAPEMSFPTQAVPGEPFSTTSAASAQGGASPIGPAAGAAAAATVGVLHPEPAPEKPQEAFMPPQQNPYPDPQPVHEEAITDNRPAPSSLRQEAEQAFPHSDYSRREEFARGGAVPKYEPDTDLQSMFLRYDNRLNRKRYIFRSFALGAAVSIITKLIAIIAVSMQSSAIATLGTIISIAAAIPSFMLIIRRLHDLNRPTWWCIGLFIPLVNLVLGIYLLFFKGTDGPNDYGPDPLEVPGGLL